MSCRRRPQMVAVHIGILSDETLRENGPAVGHCHAPGGPWRIENQPRRRVQPSEPSRSFIAGTFPLGERSVKT